MRRCGEHEFISYVAEDENFYNYPIHYDDIKRMPDSQKIIKEVEDLEAIYRDTNYTINSNININPEFKVKNYKEFWEKSVGNTLYKKFIESYTKKMWMLEDERLIDDFTWSPKGVAIKKGPRAGWDNAISAYPKAIDGYNRIFDITEKEVDIIYNMKLSNINLDKNSVKINGEDKIFDLIINTTPLDTLFNNEFGELKFIGRNIDFIILPCKNALPENVYFTYYCGAQPYTRIVEYKKFTQYKSENTLISIEYPSKNGRYYPLPVKEEREKFEQYNALHNSKFMSIGRLGLYNYRYDIDDVIEQALDIIQRVK
jgi:UDP-galactopyranose mutase